MSAENDMAAFVINSLRVKYEASGNPLFVWNAIDLCRGSIDGKRRPIPDWCFDYLMNTANEMMKLLTPPTKTVLSEEGGTSTTRGQWAKDKSWSGVLKDIPAALGMSKPGWNAFKAATSDEADARLAVEHKREKRSRNKTSTETTADLMERAGKKNTKAFETRLARGRSLIKQKRTP